MAALILSLASLFFSPPPPFLLRLESPCLTTGPFGAAIGGDGAAVGGIVGGAMLNSGLGAGALALIMIAACIDILKLSEKPDW